MKQISKFFTTHNYRNSYIIVAILAGLSYYFMRELFIKQDTWGIIRASPLTFNMVILFGLWGGLHNFIFKVKNPYLNIMVTAGGFIVIVLFLRIVGGIPTVFG